MMVTLTRQQIGTLQRALQIYLKLGLMKILSGGCYDMSNIELLIGKSSAEGERTKQARIALQAQKDGGQVSGYLSATCPPEIKLEIERGIEKDQGQPALNSTQLVIQYTILSANGVPFKSSSRIFFHFVLRTWPDKPCCLDLFLYIPPEYFPLDQRRESGWIVALLHALKPHPADVMLAAK